MHTLKAAGSAVGTFTVMEAWASGKVLGCLQVHTQWLHWSWDFNETSRLGFKKKGRKRVVFQEVGLYEGENYGALGSKNFRLFIVAVVLAIGS